MNIVIIGFGAMGQGITQLITSKRGCKITGIIDKNPLLTGKRASEFITIKKENDLIIQQDMGDIQHTAGDIAVITTGSSVKNVSPVIIEAVNAGMHVITIAEEMAYPWVTDPILADIIDEKAKEKGVTVLGTGINPGFILDLLIIMLSSVCQEVTSVKAVRVNDLSPFGDTVLHSQGVGKTVEQFEEGIKNGDIVGHVGFPQSVALIADAFGWEIDEVIETKEPIVSKVRREHSSFNIQPGIVVGCNHTAVAKSGGKTVIKLEHPQQVFPQAEGIKTKDEIIINGTPKIDLQINPEIPGGIGTIAIAVNMLPLVIEAEKGLITMKDLPGIPTLFRGVKTLFEVKK